MRPQQFRTGTKGYDVHLPQGLHTMSLAQRTIVTHWHLHSHEQTPNGPTFLLPLVRAASWEGCSGKVMRKGRTVSPAAFCLSSTS